MRKKIELIILLLLIGGLSILNKKLEKQVISEKIDTSEYRIVIDAGHGGSDPGKVGDGNILEKDINLEIARKVEERLKKEKMKVIMTRREDEMLSGENGLSEKKADLKARADRINETMPKLAVSIHQNSYPDKAVSGAQVFYYRNSKESEKAAQFLQNALLDVDPGNHRKIKANDSYYLLKKTKVPTVIIECGFLSNSAEAQNLMKEEYQEKIADAICEGILQFLFEEKGDTENT